MTKRKKSLGLIGAGAFWLLWPVWYIYFKLRPERSRVLVVCGNELLLLRGLLSPGRYGLAGGGKNRSETYEQCAVRELHEETGIVSHETALEFIGTKNQSAYGLKYKSYSYVLRLTEKPLVRLRHFEILDSRWVRSDEIEKLRVDKDVLFALKRFVPNVQESLL